MAVVVVMVSVGAAVGVTVIVPMAVRGCHCARVHGHAAVAMVVVAVAVIQARIIGGGTHLVSSNSPTLSRARGTSPFTDRRMRASFLTSLISAQRPQAAPRRRGRTCSAAGCRRPSLGLVRLPYPARRRRRLHRST